jgi:hypothetical protein
MGIMAFINLAFILVLIATLLNDDISQEEKISRIISFVFVVGMFSFPLYFGYRLYNKAKNESIQAIPLAQAGRTILLHVKIHPIEYYKLLLLLLYRTPVMIFITFLGLCFLLFPIVQGNFEYFPFQTSFGIFTLLFPFFSYFQAKKNYQTNKYINEEIQYRIDGAGVNLKGKTFESTFQWSAFFRAKELEGWFLLYTSNQTLLSIPKASFNSKKDIEDFKSFILSSQTIKKELQTA